jgi:hypothetical protein
VSIQRLNELTVFASLLWSDQYPRHKLRAVSSSYLDHAPLLLHTNLGPPASKHFRFESNWPRLPGYLEAVQLGWHCTLLNADACRVLDFKLHNTVKELKHWRQKFMGSVRLQLAVTNEIIFKLDQVQDHC